MKLSFVEKVLKIVLNTDFIMFLTVVQGGLGIYKL